MAQRSDRFRIYPTIVLLAPILLTAWLPGTGFPSPIPASTLAPAAFTPLERSTEADPTVIRRLIDAGWTADAAAAVAVLNRDHFAMLGTEHPEALEKTLLLLQRLGDYPSILHRIARHPELASLLAGTTRPRELGRVLDGTHCLGATSGFFQIVLDTVERQDLIAALQRHGRRICDLADLGIPIPAALFMFDRGRPGAEEYARWLDETMEQTMRSERRDELLAEVVALALNQGTGLRQRMEREAEFRRVFRTRLWPAFARVTDCSRHPEGACDTAFEFLADEPRVWDLLLLDDGEELLASRGLLAVELLVDNPAGDSFPSALRPLAHEALLAGDDATLGALIRFSDRPLFQTLMRRPDLDPELRRRMLAEVAATCPEDAAQCPGLEDRLHQLIGFPVGTLREDLGPAPSGPQTWLPLYSAYYAGKKLAQGRDVDAWDILFATLDVVPVGIIVPGKTAAQNLAKVTAKAMIKKTGQKLWHSNGDRLEAMIVKGYRMSALTKQYLQPLISLHGRADDTIIRVTQIDITQPLQWIFSKTGVGHISMKKLASLDARIQIIMRHDARILIRPIKLRVGELTEETATNAGMNMLSANESVQATFDQTVETLDAWQRHASAWWLTNAVGAF